jgi:hypothetical protein
LLLWNSHAERTAPVPSISVHQNLQQLKIDGSFFCDQSLRIVSDAFLPISQLLSIKRNTNLFFSSNLDC